MNKKQIEISQFLKLHSCKIHKCICMCNTHIYSEQTTHQLYFNLILPDNFTRVRMTGQVNMHVNSERQSLSSRRTMIFLFYKFLCRSNPVRVSTFLIVWCFGWNYNPPANHITVVFKQEVDGSVVSPCSAKTCSRNIQNENFTCSKMPIHLCS